MQRAVTVRHFAATPRGARRSRPTGATLDELLADLDRRFPGFRFRVIDEQDRVRRHVIIFVGGEATIIWPPVPDADLSSSGALSGG